MTDPLQPLRLAVGSHRAGSGKGCGMNVISWENGDQQITDYPDCADPLLARIVQVVNDSYCTHCGPLDASGAFDLLCPPCSVEVLALAHRTVGTGTAHPSRRLRVAAELAVALVRAELDAPEANRLSLRWRIADERLRVAETWLAHGGREQREAVATEALRAGTEALRAGVGGLPTIANPAVQCVAYAAIVQPQQCRDMLVTVMKATVPEHLSLVDHAHSLFDRYLAALNHQPLPALAPDAVDQAIARMLAREDAPTP